ncbi:MAG: GxxExxY protein [Opitutales bacterium]
MNTHEHKSLLLREEVDHVVGAASEVSNKLGPGLLEKPYENAMAVEFGLRGIPLRQQVPFKVEFKDTVVGEYACDLLAFDSLVFEVKAVQQINDVHRAQFLNQPHLSGKSVDLRINSGPLKAEWGHMVF